MQKDASMASRISDRTVNIAVSVECWSGTPTEVAEADPTNLDTRAAVVLRAVRVPLKRPNVGYWSIPTDVCWFEIGFLEPRRDERGITLSRSATDVSGELFTVFL